MIEPGLRERLSGEEDICESLLREYQRTVKDRLCLRLGTAELPAEFKTICEDATVKMYRRYYYEGITSESDGGLSVSFVENILNEYSEEIEAYKSRSRQVRFI